MNLWQPPAEKQQPEFTLECSVEAPGILYGLCYDSEHQHLYGAGADFAVYRVDLAAELAIAAEQRAAAQAQSASGKTEGGQPAEKPAAKTAAPQPPRTAEKLWTHHDSYVSSLVWRDGVVISAGYDRRLVWTTAASGEKRRELATAHAGWIRKLVLLPGGELLASAGDDMQVKLWDAATGQAVRTLAGHAARTPQGFATALYALAAAPDGKHLAAADRTGDVRVWETATGKPLSQFRAPDFYTYDSTKRDRSIGGVRALAFSPDGQALLLGGIGPVTNVDGFVGPCRVELWNWAQPARTFLGQDKHHAILNDVACHPSGWLLGCGGGDGGGVLAAWDRKGESATLKAKPKGHLQQLLLVADGARLLCAGFGGFQVWNCRLG